MPPILELDAISKRFGPVQAMRDVSLSFRAGEVHAVIGENGAGKSTMMNVIAGEIAPDSGTIRLDGAETRRLTPQQSGAHGIRVVFQELSLCDNLSVGENVLLSDFAARPGLAHLNTARAGRAAREALDRLGLDEIATDTPLRSLTIAQKQLVEIARAISQDARVLILDEPNSALSPPESERLFTIVRKLRAEGVAVIYVSHHLQEVLDLADHISVMRDGALVASAPRGDHTTVEDLVGQMVGRALNAFEQYATSDQGRTPRADPVLEVAGLCVPGQIWDAGFDLSPGEILGVAGLPDSGKDILAEAIFGLTPRGGIVRIGGITLSPGRPAHAIAAGIALVPADRRGAGALLEMSVAENVVSSSLRRFVNFGVLRRGRIADAARGQVRDLDVRVAELGQKIATLSGGNQQKVILARGLIDGPKVLILQEPTRGIDVGAKAEIYRLLKDLARDGMAILMISSELPEIVLHSSRVVVMAGGRVTGTLTGAAITEQAIMAHAVDSATAEEAPA